DPLAPEAPLAFCFSPLVGTPLTTSAKVAVVAKSPLTRLLNDALASSHFAIAGKLTGHDAIVVRGACAEPSVLLIDGDGPRLEPAGDLWGLPAANGEERPRRRAGDALGVRALRPRRGARGWEGGWPGPRWTPPASGRSSTRRSPTTAATPAAAASARCSARSCSR